MSALDVHINTLHAATKYSAEQGRDTLIKTSVML